MKDVDWENDTQDSFYVDESVLKLFYTPPYSCRGRVMTKDEVAKWEKGQPLLSSVFAAQTELVKNRMVVTHEPRDV